MSNKELLTKENLEKVGNYLAELFCGVMVSYEYVKKEEVYRFYTKEHTEDYYTDLTAEEVVKYISKLNKN